MLVRLLPQGALSRSWGWLARRRLPRPLQGFVNRVFARIVGADLREAEAPPSEYRSLSEFFVRRLRPGARSWPEHGGVPGSPVDGVLGPFGELSGGTLVQAKGLTYSVARLLGDETSAARFDYGIYFTLYLGPRHYHRVHAPLSGELYLARAIPGRLMPVHPAAVRSIPGLFPRNERLVTLHESGRIRVALVAVGAYNVGSIAATFDPQWQAGHPAGVTNRGGTVRERGYDPPLAVERGEELMTFHFGSTVVLLLSGDGIEAGPPHPSLIEGGEVRVGMSLLTGELDPTPNIG